VREPAGCAAGEEGHKRRGRREDLPRPAVGTVAADDLVERQPFRHYFFQNCAITGADALGLRPPGGDRYGLLRMSSKPGGDGLHAVGRQFAIDIGVQFILSHG